jgi:hypothetical protein
VPSCKVGEVLDDVRGGAFDLEVPEDTYGVGTLVVPSCVRSKDAWTATFVPESARRGVEPIIGDVCPVLSLLMEALDVAYPLV